MSDITVNSVWVHKEFGHSAFVYDVANVHIRYSMLGINKTVTKAVFLDDFKPIEQEGKDDDRPAVKLETKTDITDDYVKCPKCLDPHHKNTVNASHIHHFGECNSCQFLGGVSKKYLTKETLDKELDKNTVIGTLAGNGSRYFYITYTYFVGGKRRYKKGSFFLETDNGEIFNIDRLRKTIVSQLKIKMGVRSKLKSVSIDNWIEMNKADHKQMLQDTE
jgi:hypothetical protein